MLAQVQKLKAQEADMQWRMERDARKENEDAQKEFENDLMQWRWQQVREGAERADEPRSPEHAVAATERDYQAHGQVGFPW